MRVKHAGQSSIGSAFSIQMVLAGQEVPESHRPLVAAPDVPPALMDATESSDEEILPDLSEDDSEDVGDELAILQIMEVTSLHRGQAIEMLNAHDGDLQLVLEAVFG